MSPMSALRERAQAVVAVLMRPMNCDPQYPLWIGIWINGGAVGGAVAAVVQRWDDGRLLAVVLMSVALVPYLAETVGRLLPGPVVFTLTGGSCAALMALEPRPVDFVPFVLLIMVGCFGAYLTVRRALLPLAATVGLLVVLQLTTDALGPGQLAVWVAGVLIGWELGVILRAQQLRIDAQHGESLERAAQAVLSERQRIAREVHDVVAHSLSVTMLHLTAARRDLEDGADPAEAIDALREAERVGRQAMGDVRRTVRLLGEDEPAGAPEAPAPGLDDLTGLIADFRRAGLGVALEAGGDLGAVPATTALGIYRIVQESLTNVAKHAPHSAVTVTVDLASDPGRVSVVNACAGIGPAAGGSGLIGMAARAQQLGGTLVAGASGDDTP